ncbi:hypothetical protein Pfo_028802 [Paulownia fortunei]|nr:hypothetical protein Pfo_028802 [Paulownia fortunei]
MNLLARAKLSPHLIFSSPSPGQRLFYLHPITALQQCNFYSSKTTRSSQQAQQLTKPRTQKTSGSSLSFSQRIKKQTEALTTVWPKPREIPYQEKVANFVNLIGYVQIPVRFEAASDGKHFATAVISLGDGAERNSLSVPVVFEGDLAHVVACHVKENDCVFVSGQLSVDPIRLVLSEGLGKFHVVAENLNFVEGFEKNALDKKMGVSFSSVEIDKPIEVVFENAKASSSVESSFKPLLNADASTTPAATLERGNDESIPEKGNEKSGESASKKKDGDQILDLWRDLVKNPLQWWDYRNHKTNGLVKEKFPDFKQKVTGESLWVNSAPKWVLTGLGKLEFDVKDFKPKQVQGENPDKWWDNRTKKRNPKAPDFRHKETGEVLWLNKSPVWALSRLPPMKDGQNSADGKNMPTL